MGGDAPWESYRRCLTDPDPQYEHLLVIQDDATPCRGFAERAHRAVDAHAGPVAMFLPNTSLNNVQPFLSAQRTGEDWVRLVTTDFVPVVALAWPTVMIHDFLDWAAGAGYDNARRRTDDAIVAEWANRRNVTVVATVPSLVQHDDRVPSVWGTRLSHGPPRTAISWEDDAAPDRILVPSPPDA